jgi:hypothetical protein
VQALVARALRASSVTSGGWEPGGELDSLARRVVAFQAEHVAPVSRLHRARDFHVGGCTSVDAVPAVPADVFALTRVAAHPPSADLRVFRTSGTTRAGVPRGEHPFRRLDTYERAARAFASMRLFPADRASCIALTAPDGPEGESSLSFMVDRFIETLGGTGTHHLHPERGLDHEGVRHACAEVREAGRPALVMATSFALVHLLDAVRSGCELPTGSRVMFTGGFKGRSRELAPDELRREVAARFAIPERDVIGEYGMTELSSQAYEARAGVYAVPPWVRVTAVDPTDLRPVPDGEVGLARIVDLANIDSTLVVQTADRVRTGPDGFEILGRASGAPPRGCALAVDQMLSHAE